MIIIRHGLFRHLSLLIAFFIFSLPATGQQKGTVKKFVFNSAEITIPRVIEVWLPADYDPSRKYSVFYVHDGQSVSGLASKLYEHIRADGDTIAENTGKTETKPFIMVGISNRYNYRFTEYFPQKILDGLKESKRKKITSYYMIGQPMSDSYLRFIVRELKPYIDKHYPTHADRDNTFIMGYSLGGLISLYGMCEYPEIFGGAVCLSTHWPLTEIAPFNRTNTAQEKAFLKYLGANIPDPATHRIYYDHGTEDLDSCYAKHQRLIDGIMRDKGYTEENWMTRVFPGDDHSLRAWSKRLYIPVVFLLGKK